METLATHIRPNSRETQPASLTTHNTLKYHKVLLNVDREERGKDLPIDSNTDACFKALGYRHPLSHKGNYGHVLVIGGCRGMTGAVGIASLSAIRSGSGLVTAFIPRTCIDTVAGVDPCIMTGAGEENSKGEFSIAAVNAFKMKRGESWQAIVIGPGLGNKAGAQLLVRYFAAKCKTARVFDADALNILALDNIKVSGSAVLTPHPGEFERLTGISRKNRPAQIAAAKEFASRTECVVVLKGNRSVVTDGKATFFNFSGNSGMATGGSGDCLSGVIASLLGQGLSAFDAARLGTYLHGAAGDLAAKNVGLSGMTATDIVTYLPEAFRLYHYRLNH